MSAYVVGLFAITNEREILRYGELVDATVTKYGGRFIVKGGRVAEVLEGDLHPQTASILEFPTLKQAQNWYRSPEYRAIIGHRHDGVSGPVILVGESQ